MENIVRFIICIVLVAEFVNPEKALLKLKTWLDLFELKLKMRILFALTYYKKGGQGIIVEVEDLLKYNPSRKRDIEYSCVLLSYLEGVLKKYLRDKKLSPDVFEGLSSYIQEKIRGFS